MHPEMAFRVEAEMREPVTVWLRGEGFDVCDELPFLRWRADLVGVRAGRVAAIELKLDHWRSALRQAVAYQVAADWSWVALPLRAAGRAYRERWRFEAEGVGLLAVDDTGGVRVPLPARRSPRLLDFAQEALAASAESVRGPLLFSIEETDLEAF